MAVQIEYELAKSVFMQNPDTGRIVSLNGRAKCRSMKIGYRRVRKTIGGVKYELYAHRLAWLLNHGEWPDGEIDHINGDKSDNRIKNLRCVSRVENARNVKRRSDNTSGITGIRRHQRGWKCVIGRRYVGYFGCLADAIKARSNAEKTHGYHKNHGRA